MKQAGASHPPTQDGDRVDACFLWRQWGGTVRNYVGWKHTKDEEEKKKKKKVTPGRTRLELFLPQLCCQHGTRALSACCDGEKVQLELFPYPVCLDCSFKLSSCCYTRAIIMRLSCNEETWSLWRCVSKQRGRGCVAFVFLRRFSAIIHTHTHTQIYVLYMNCTWQWHARWYKWRSVAVTDWSQSGSSWLAIRLEHTHTADETDQSGGDSFCQWQSGEVTDLFCSATLTHGSEKAAPHHVLFAL